MGCGVVKARSVYIESPLKEREKENENRIKNQT